MLIVARPQTTFINPIKNNSSKGIYLFFLLYTFNCVFALWEWDTYHIWNDFIRASRYYYFKITGYEDVYNNLAQISGSDYWIWRSFIWIPACLFIFLSAKKIDILNRNFLVAVALFVGFAAFTRGMLGHTMLVYGLILLIDNNSKKASRIIGLILIILSYFFHKSMYIQIIFAVIALFPLNKKWFKLSLIAFPFLTTFATLIVDNIASGLWTISLADGVGGVGDRTNIYISAEKSAKNFNGYIGDIIKFLPEYVSIIYISIRVVYQKCFVGLKQEKIYTYLFWLTYYTIYIASLFYFVETSSWIYIRFKYMCFFPLIFVLGKLWSMETKTNKWIKFIILFQIISLLLKYSLQLRDWYQLS